MRANQNRQRQLKTEGGEQKLMGKIDPEARRSTCSELAMTGKQKRQDRR
jgi:hypothetical protein